MIKYIVIPFTGRNILHLIHVYGICVKLRDAYIEILGGKVITTMMEKIYPHMKTPEKQKRKKEKAHVEIF